MLEGCSKIYADVPAPWENEGMRWCLLLLSTLAASQEGIRNGSVRKFYQLPSKTQMAKLEGSSINNQERASEPRHVVATQGPLRPQLGFRA